MEPSFRRKLLTSIAACYIAFGLKLIIWCFISAFSTDGSGLIILGLVSGMILGGFTLASGLELWRDRPLGIPLAAATSALQVPQLLFPGPSFKFVAGPCWAWLVGVEGGNVFATSQFDVVAYYTISQAMYSGDFIIGVNVIALAATIWLVKQARTLRREGPAVEAVL